MGPIDHYRKIHVVGAGGVGLSAVAKLLWHAGCAVTGSDVRGSEATADLAALGVAVAIGHDAANMPVDADLLLYSDAVPPSNPERASAAVRGVPQMSYFDFLGALSRERRTVSVAGTNGKSTTTSMLGLMLAAGGLDPTVVVGSRVAAFPDRNLRRGTGDLLVVESCEYRANLLKLAARAIVLTDIKADHLDFYRDLDDIRATFQKFVSSLPADGILAWNVDDAESAKLEKPARAVSYGFSEAADYRATDLAAAGGCQRFRVVRRGEDMGEFTLAVPGRFNVSNALAALTMAVELGADLEAARSSLADYRGIWRRFEIVGDKDGVTVVSDYAHHPDAVAGTIAAAREFYPGRRVVVCFQPHQRSRTRKLFSEFVASFDGADVVLLPEIYDVAGREEEGESVSSRDLAAAISERDAGRNVKRQVEFAENPSAALTWLEANARPGDVVLVMGAGDIYRIASGLLGE